jgi:hypothetical protein
LAAPPQGCNLGASRDAGQLTVVEVLAAPLDWDARALYTRIRAAVIAANADGTWPAFGRRSSVPVKLVVWGAASCLERLLLAHQVGAGGHQQLHMGRADRRRKPIIHSKAC